MPLKGAQELTSSAGDVIGSIKNTVNAIKDVLNSLGEAIDAWKQSKKAETMMTIAKAVAIMAASLTVLSMIKPERLAGGIGALTATIGELVGAFLLLDKFGGKTKSAKLGAMSMVAMASSVLILAGAAAKLASIDSEKLVSSKLNQLLITAKLQKALQNGTYHPKGSMKFRYRERGKERLISSIVTPDKAVNHVICDEVLTPYLQKFLQYDNSASQNGKGVAFHRRRFENDLRNYYREEGTNEGYVLFIDFSGYYANIQHEPCKAVLQELLEKSGLSDELRLITEDLMDEIFKTFEMDVSRFSDEDIEAMMNGKVDPFMNMGVPKELLTGEKMMAKGADIGNQLAQNIGITFPYRIDNYCKIVRGMKHQGRYSYDMHIIHRSKEVLLGVLEGIKKIAAEHGLILNGKKTHICKLSSDYRYLQVKYTLLQNGIVVRRIHPKAITRERRKLKAYKRLLDKGIVTMEEIDGYFRSWLSGNYKYMSRDQIYKMNSLYVKLFGRSVTWKRRHGRLRWLMAHPSAA